MLPIWRLALNNLSGRPGRVFVLGAAVALAASLIVAVSCAIASVQASVEQQLDLFVGAADARIHHPGQGRFEASLLDVVREWPGVVDVTGRLGDWVTLAPADQRLDPETGERLRVTTYGVGMNFDLEPRFRGIELIEGRMPGASHEILLDPIAAEQLQAGAGDLLHVQRFGAPIELTVTGIFSRITIEDLQDPLIYVDRGKLGEIAGRPDVLNTAYLILEEGIDVEQFCRAHTDDIPQTLVLEPAEKVKAGFDRRVEASRLILMLTSVITFISASFIIVTGLTTGVTEREREMALLRAVGAERRQLFFSQLIVGMIYGVGGAVIGIPLGLGLTQLLVWYYHDYVVAGLQIHDLGVLLAAIGSVASGIIGAVYPAFVASRITPLQAMTRQAQRTGTRTILTCGLVGTALVGVDVLATMLIADDEQRFWFHVTAGVPLLLLGWFLIAVPVLALLTAMLAPVLAPLLRLPSDMLRGSLLSTPFRHGFTAGALMLGMALLVDGWAAGLAIRNEWLEQIEIADSFAIRSTGIPPEQAAAIAALPFVEQTCPIGQFHVRVVGQQVFGLEGLTPSLVNCFSFDARRFFAMNAVEWVQGDPETAVPLIESGRGIVVADRFLTAKGIGVGEDLTLAVGRREETFRIVGVVNSAGLDVATQLFGIRSQYLEYAVSSVFIDVEKAASVFDATDMHVLQIDLAEWVTDEEAEARIKEVAPSVLFTSGRWILDTLDEIAIALLAVQSTVAMCALILASIAVGNVIAANTYGRRYEFGVFRSIGAQKGTVLRLILCEAGLLGLTGAVIGTGLGFHLAWIDSGHLRDLAGLEVGVAFPVVPILIGVVVLIGLTLLVTLPSALGLLRQEPALLVALGRND